MSKNDTGEKKPVGNAHGLRNGECMNMVQCYRAVYGATV